ncbi:MULTISPECIES: hypothetical protein [Pseudomonas]|uniref:Uncharacterized protein n=1 Tax=Pseudomonas fluorescens TaxID=294 RepID=A0A5E6PIA2_PSEFL|nr:MULTISPECIES: hypothetical protein [Pseudomonas]VVM42807.1 hypothetical protein PS652_00355 [Pseudomonas fluorescens]
MSVASRVDVQTLTAFVEQLFESAGADTEVAQVVTRAGVLEQVSDRGVSTLFDGHYLLGPCRTRC